ncbi:hypothetical protein GCM10025734_62220 [Kitasatospora paranensis]
MLPGGGGDQQQGVLGAGGESGAGACGFGRRGGRVCRLRPFPGAEIGSPADVLSGLGQSGKEGLEQGLAFRVVGEGAAQRSGGDVGGLHVADRAVRTAARGAVVVPDQQVHGGLGAGGQVGAGAVDVVEPGVVVAGGPGGDELVHASGVRPVALLGKSRVLEERLLGVEQVEPVEVGVEVRLDLALVEMALLHRIFAAFRPGTGSGLIQPGDPGGEGVQDPVKRRQGGRQADGDLFDLVGAQQQFAQADDFRQRSVRVASGRVGASADGDPRVVDKVEHRRDRCGSR